MGEACKQKRLRSLHKRPPKSLELKDRENWPAIDAERWLPKRDRSYYKPRRGHRKNQTRSGGTQGAGYSALNDKYDYSDKANEPAPAEDAEPKATNSPSSASSNNNKNNKNNNKHKKKSKRR